MIQEETSLSPYKNLNIKIDKINEDDCNINSSRISTRKENRINFINDKKSSQNKIDEYIKNIENNNG
jgi:hypothetical protein